MENRARTRPQILQCGMCVSQARTSSLCQMPALGVCFVPRQVASGSLILWRQLQELVSEPTGPGPHPTRLLPSEIPNEAPASHPSAKSRSSLRFDCLPEELTELGKVLYLGPAVYLKRPQLQNCWMEETRGLGGGLGACMPLWGCHTPCTCTPACSSAQKLPDPRGLGTCVEVSLHRQDWLHHWPCTVGQTLAPVSSPEVQGTAGGSKLLSTCCIFLAPAPVLKPSRTPPSVWWRFHCTPESSSRVCIVVAALPPRQRNTLKQRHGQGCHGA